MCSFLRIVLLISAGAFATDIAVMAPLDPRKDPSAVNKLLKKVREAGATSISVDVWWGATELRKGDYHWEEYDMLFQRIRDTGHLSITPILSLHACGGNVGDQCDFPIPGYVWNLPSGTGTIRGYYDAQGRVDTERVPPWHQVAALESYRKWMIAFRDHYDSLGMLNSFHEINISLGPSGELRYPAYQKEGCGYPLAGCYQFQSSESRKDTLDNNFQIRYQRELFTAGSQLLQLSDSVFQGKKAGKIHLGFKWPGLHWRWGNWSNGELGDVPRPDQPYGVLFRSGLLIAADTIGGMDSLAFKRSLGRFWSTIPEKVRPRLVMHFTSLEQADKIRDSLERKDKNGNVVGKTDSLVWAKPQELVRWMAWSGKELGIPMKGENALDGNLKGSENWDRISRNLKCGYSGVTLLRLEIFDSPDALGGLRKLKTELNSFP